MIRNQMLCIVTPGAPVAVPGSITRRLDTALRSTDCIHFATLALLPPAPDGEGSAAPSLLLEVVVDERIKPQEAVDILLRAGFGVLWRLYRHAWTGSEKSGVEVRRRWLRAYLIAHIAAADCGFVGARDRHVTQILCEAELLRGARQQLPALHRGTAQTGLELAERIRQWAIGAGFRWAGEPARRSIWRHGSLPKGLRSLVIALRMGMPAFAVVSMLGWLGFVVAWLPRKLANSLNFGDVNALMVSDVGIPLLTVVALLFSMMIVMLLVGARSIRAVLAMLLFAIFALPTGIAAVGILLGSYGWSMVWCSAQLVLVGVFAMSAALSGLAAVLPLAAMYYIRITPWFPALGLLGLSAFMGGFTFIISNLAQGQLGSLACPDLNWPKGSPIPLGTRIFWIAVTTALMGLFTGLALKVMPWVGICAKEQIRKMESPRQLASGPLHQVHSSVDECEAALVGRQSHMISLSEIRAPVWWHGTRLRICLALISQLAEVHYTAGRLGTADGIKFGHWRIINKGQRLLFCSNYDGAFGGYLDEFIRGASQGVNLIWGCSELRPRPPARADQPAVSSARQFPQTKLLVFKGCKHEQAFKAYARISMVPHLYRFEAYNLSLQDIERATRLRDALCLPRSALKSEIILRAIES
jgi:hypothetical protein